MSNENVLLAPSDYGEDIKNKLSLYLEASKCAKCLLPSDFRAITLDDSGVCNYCHNYEVLSDPAEESKRYQEFIKILERARKKAGTSYDCIICLSGGKDSTYLLDLFKEEYKLKIIAVTVDTGFLSDTAKQNIRKAISKLQVEHVFLKAPSEIYDIYRYGFTHPGNLGIENDVCDLCDGIIRKEIAQFAIDNNIPLIADGLDPFQLIDAGLHRPDPGIENALSCWPEHIRHDGLFKKLYELNNFREEVAPFELYPFLYLPYDTDLIWEKVEEREILVDPDPNVTNCRFTYLLDFLDLVRRGFPAYAHTTSSELRQGKISLETAREWMKESFLEYAENFHDEQVLNAIRSLDLDLHHILGAND